MVAVVLCQVRWCQPIDVSVCWLGLIGQQDSAALTGGMRLIEKQQNEFVIVLDKYRGRNGKSVQPPALHSRQHREEGSLPSNP